MLQDGAGDDSDDSDDLDEANAAKLLADLDKDTAVSNDHYACMFLWHLQCDRQEPLRVLDSCVCVLPDYQAEAHTLCNNFTSCKVTQQGDHNAVAAKISLLSTLWSVSLQTEHGLSKDCCTITGVRTVLPGH